MKKAKKRRKANAERDLVPEEYLGLDSPSPEELAAGAISEELRKRGFDPSGRSSGIPPIPPSLRKLLANT